MTTKAEVITFLESFHFKMKIWDILFRDERGKNTQALIDLEITPNDRVRIIEDLKPEDFSEGPVHDVLYQKSEMWIFGKIVKGKEVYIKITMGAHGASVICISFHAAEHAMKYPFKK